jgi:membrane fusion protein, multidrug efflux system
MKRLIVIFIAVLFTITFFSCGKKTETQNGNNKKLPLIQYKEIIPETFSEKFKIIGTVKPYASAKLSSEEGGLITWLSKDKGDRVYRGETVIRLKRDVDNAIYQQSIAQYNLAKDNYERAERLYKENVATERDYMNAKLGLDIAEKSLDLYRTRLSKGYVSSPISGVVDAKFMNRGEMTGPGVPIISIVDISRVKISVGIPERYMTAVKTGLSVDITFDVFPDESFTGIISYVSPTISTSNRTFEIEIILNNYDRRFKPEMPANITITKETSDDAIVLEQDMVVDNGDEQFVFILENNEIARKKNVKLGGRNGNKVLIAEGLNAGDKLINVGFQVLTDGDKVQLGN